MANKPWGGRFDAPTDKSVEEFTTSLPFDVRLYTQDISCSMAHARMLGKVGLVPTSDVEKIIAGLAQIEKDIEAGEFPFAPGDEDIHMAVERVLTDRIGEPGARLHTGRSRNDQVATDLRLWAKEQIGELGNDILAFQQTLITRAKEHLSDPPTVLPGYTHLQRAMPVPLAHHLLAYFWMLERDKGRLLDCLLRMDESPLGSAALAGSGLPLDREMTAVALGFSRVSENSLDAVSDRDFVIELLSALSVMIMHLSRLAEETITWASSEFKYISLPDAYATGSSMMPQKKNPDIAELVRGKTGRVFGSLVGLLTTLKGLPLAYNRDLQEDKEGLFDAVDTLRASLSVMTGLFGAVIFNSEVMKAAVSDDDLYATDIMEYLVAKGVPLRSAHHAVGGLVKTASDKGVGLSQLTPDEYQAASKSFADDIGDYFSAQHSVASKNIMGSSGIAAVKQQLEHAEAAIDMSGSGDSSA